VTPIPFHTCNVVVSRIELGTELKVVHWYYDREDRQITWIRHITMILN
jgi:hypothetical protein